MTHIDGRIRFLEELKDEGHTHVAMFVIDMETLFYLPEVKSLLAQHFGDDNSPEAVEAKWEFLRYLWPDMVDDVEDQFFAEVSSDPVTYSLRTAFRAWAENINDPQGGYQQLLSKLSAQVKLAKGSKKPDDE